MCENYKWIHKVGNYKDDCWAGVKGSHYDFPLYVGCGNCYSCNSQKSSNWVIRAYRESKDWNENISFITLTYDKKNYPYLPEPTKKDKELFIKRLRRYYEYHFNKKLRYFGVCEMGERTKRWHLHIILYGYVPLLKNLTYMGKNKKGYPVFKDSQIERLWGKGITSISIFNKKEIPYICLYTTVKSNLKKKYVQTRESLTKLQNHIKNRKEFRPDLNKYLTDLIKKLETEKKKFYKTKEYNFWSKSLGFQNWYNEVLVTQNYDFKEYFLENTMFCPSPWIKKIANNCDYDEDLREKCVKEMEKRTEIALNQVESQIERKQSDAVLKKESDRVKNILDHKKNEKEL